MRISKAAAVVFGLAAAFGSEPALADVSSWMFVGGGVSSLTLPETTADGSLNATAGALQIDTGFGSAPTHPLVVGFVVKSLTQFGHGTDLGLALRTTTRGYSLGDWGASLDLGASQRFWGQPATLASAGLSAGLPWGLTLSATASSDFGKQQSLALALGLDWARLTVHRASGDGWWRNYRLPVADREVAAAR